MINPSSNLSRYYFPKSGQPPQTAEWLVFDEACVSIFKGMVRGTRDDSDTCFIGCEPAYGVGQIQWSAIASVGLSFMYEEKFMDYVIGLSRKAVDQPGTQPFGAILVKNGAIVGEGLNHELVHRDPTAHGEVEAIRMPVVEWRRPI